MTIESRRMKWAKRVAGLDRMTVAYKILVRKCERNIPLKRYRRRWYANIKTYLKGTMCEDVDWTRRVTEWNQ
jgi:hypothetical protein